MRRMLARVSSFLTFALCLLPFALPSQSRDGQPVAASGTGRIEGRVVMMDAAAQPVANAIVTIAAPELPRGRSAVTNDEGRFAFSNLPAARFTVTASKPSYITTAYGAKRPGRPGTPVPVASGQSIKDVTVRLARGAVITGRVTERDGQPAGFLRVLAIPADQASGAGGAPDANADPFVTDDRGVYRIFGLQPGAYVVAAIPRASGPGELEVMSTSDVDAKLARLRQPRNAPMTMPVAGAIGGAPGGATPAAAPAATPPRSLAMFTPIFFPGTASAADAEQVTLAIGEERGGIDIVVEPVRANVVEGIIMMGDGSPLGSVGVGLATDGPPMPPGFGTQPMLSALPGADGRFKYTGVAPGTYTLLASTNAATGPPASAGTRSGLPPGLRGAGSLYAFVEVAVTTDITGLMLTLQPAMHFKGRVVFEGTTAAPPADLTKLLVTLSPPAASASGPAIPSLNQVAGAALGSDGSFDVVNVMPTTYRVSLPMPGTPTGTGWWLRSAMAGGMDLLDTMFDARRDGGIADAVLTVSDRHTELTGTLQTPAGQPASDCFVIAFTTDRSLWKPQARRLRAARPGTDGAFSFKDLPPGGYFLAALTDIDRDEWQDPAFLSQVAAAGAITITIGEGAQKVQNLRIAG